MFRQLDVSGQCLDELVACALFGGAGREFITIPELLIKFYAKLKFNRSFLNLKKKNYTISHIIYIGISHVYFQFKNNLKYLRKTIL